ncbi:MAG TPA: YegP family protein [Arenibacter sp.]|nr:YegP family protein [Arenibacter sp.]
MIETRLDPEKNFTFNILSNNGQTLLKSIPFSERPSLEAISAQLKELATQPSSFERTTDYNGKFLFLLKDGLGKTIGYSMYYSSEAGMENGIENLKIAISHLPDDGYL